MQRLCEKIANWGGYFGIPKFSVGGFGEMMASLQQKERRLISKAIALNADNVADLYFQSPQEEWEYKAFPNIAPPWFHCFVDFSLPKTINIDGRDEPCAGRGFGGAHVWTMDFDRAPGTIEVKADAAAVISGRHPDGLSKEERSFYASLAEDARWVCVISPWASLNNRPLLGRPMQLGGRHVISIGHDGRYRQDVIVCFCDEGSQSVARDAVTLYTPVVLLAFSLANCKNTAVRDDESHRLASANKRHLNGWRGIRYKVLQISSPGHQGVGSINGESSRSLHICRGHFRTYSEGSSGLFGKLHGTFWVPQHTRGNVREGVVIKDYAFR